MDNDDLVTDPDEPTPADYEPPDRRPTLLLVDGYGLIFRAYHAVPSGIATSKGEQVNPVFGFASMLPDMSCSERTDDATSALGGGRTSRQDAGATARG